MKRWIPIALASAVMLVAPARAADDLESPGPTFDPPAAEVIEGELAIDFRDDVPEEEMAAAARAVGIGLHASSPWSHEHDKIEVGAVSPGKTAAVIAALRADPRVEHVEPMTVLEASWVPNDPFYKDQWHLPRAGAEGAWAYGCGQGVTVAVIDTGVACFDHGPFTKGTDLKGTRCVAGYDFVNDRAEAADDHGHGTHVAGTIAQTTNNGHGVAGLAHCARLMPIKVLNGGGWGTVADVASGIRFAADNGAQVVNMSLGGRIKSDILQSAVRHALKKGVVIVAAAGNTRRSVEWPAAYPGVLAISATDQKDALAWFSSRGPEVAIAAPGVDVVQQTVCNGGHDKCEIFGKFSGTSMASPHVAGAAALLVGAGVTDPDAVRSALGVAARAPSTPDPNKFGAGHLDAGAALSRAHWAHALGRVALLAVLGWIVSRRVKAKGGTFDRGRAMVFGALLAGVGLLVFAPLLGVAPRLGPARLALEVLMRPFGEWDLVFDAGLHRFLPLANALPVIALASLFFGVPRLRSFTGGFALGMAALLLQLAWAGEVATPFGGLATRLWVVLNAAVCLFVARLALDRR
ncbi:MAG: peptidase S8 [Deltaproteobacteria bacterium]|nr:peptidase S8 [Deltaproteobacteria bacterium]